MCSEDMRLCSDTAVAVQNAASTLLPASKVDTGRSGTLQCTDVAVTRSAEARTDVHGDQ